MENENVKRAVWIALAAAIVLLPVPTRAQSVTGAGARGPMVGGLRRSRGTPPEFLSDLYPPRLVMRHQSELALTDEQRSAIMEAIREARDSVDPVEWDLQRAQQKLASIVATPRIDESDLLAQAETVMDLEKKLKTAHLLLLVKIKNELTPAQQEQAKRLREQDLPRSGMGPGRPAS